MIDFLPAEAKPHERAILILYYVLKVQHPEQIKRLLNYETKHTIYRTLKKYRCR